MPKISRRSLIAATGAVLAVPLSGVRANASVAPRSLALDNLHTGEKLQLTYWEKGVLIPEALAAVDHVLRDYRTNEVHRIDPTLLDLLHTLHTRLGSGAPFQVISGYRSPKTNAGMRAASHNVATKSLHMQGMAVDIRLADRSLENIHAVARALRAGGVGYYPGQFVHVDVGRVRYW